MAVQIDETGGDEAITGIDNLCGVFGIDRGLDGRDATVRDGDIARSVDTGGRIDQAATLDQEIELHRRLPPCLV